MSDTIETIRELNDQWYDLAKRRSTLAFEIHAFVFHNVSELKEAKKKIIELAGEICKVESKLCTLQPNYLFITNTLMRVVKGSPDTLEIIRELNDKWYDLAKHHNALACMQDSSELEIIKLVEAIREVEAERNMFQSELCLGIPRSAY